MCERERGGGVPCLGGPAALGRDPTVEWSKGGPSRASVGRVRPSIGRTTVQYCSSEVQLQLCRKAIKMCGEPNQEPLMSLPPARLPAQTHARSINRGYMTHPSTVMSTPCMKEALSLARKTATAM